MNIPFTIDTSKSAKSERFSQLRFADLRFRSENKIKKFIKIVFDFFKSIYKYLLRKIGSLISLFFSIFPLLMNSTGDAKRLLTGKLIWSRGKLGRPLATFAAISAALLVFMLGKVFNSSKLVNSQEISPDYLANVTDIIPQRNIALTIIPENRKNESIAYVVQPGDTLSGIGNKFKISVDALMYVNGLSDASFLKAGQSVTIPPLAGLIHKVKSGETLESIAAKYGVSAQNIADFNYILDSSKLTIGIELVVPGAKVPAPVIVPVIPTQFNAGPIIDTGASRGWCIWPTSARIITTYFTWYHNGVDIANPTGYVNLPPLWSCAAGTVVRAGWDPWGLGLHVRISHGSGYETVYGHMSRIDVEVGERVSQGEQVGIMGSTGHSTGPHVHFMVKYKENPQNPLDYIN